MSEKKIGGDLFDFVKLLLALFVFCIHAKSLRIYNCPVLRIAVPLFFIITSYFFFSKYDKEADPSAKKSIFRKYVIRNVVLYLIWTVAQIYPILQYRAWFENPFPENVLYMLRSVFFGGTFVASWFISGCVIAIAISIVVSRKGVNRVSVFISAAFFLLSALFSNYRHAFLISDAFFEGYSDFFLMPYNSFVIAFPWITAGRLFANREVRRKTSWLSVTAFLSFAMLLVENRWVVQCGFSANRAVYISLAILCPSLFALLLKAPALKIPGASAMRHLSVVIFCTHGTLLYCFSILFELLGSAHNKMWATILTLPCCFLIYLLVDFLAKRHKIFRYAY